MRLGGCRRRHSTTLVGIHRPAARASRAPARGHSRRRCARVRFQREAVEGVQLRGRQDGGFRTFPIYPAGEAHAPIPDLPAPARNGEIRPFPGGSRQGVRRFSKASISSGNLRKPRPHGSRAQCIFVDLAVLHDHMKVLRRMRHELNVLKGISADNQKIGKRALLDDAQPSGIRIAWTG